MWSIYEDRAGTIWIGTNSVLSRLNQNDANSAKFMNYQHSPKKLQSLNRYPIRAMCEDRNGTFWFATLNGGLGKLDRTTGEITYYKHDPDNPKSIGSNNIYTIFEDRAGTLWIGLNGSGLSRLETDHNLTAEFTNYNFNLNSSEPTIWWVITINESQYAWDGALWLGTWEKGLIKFDREKNEFIYYTRDPSDPGSLSNNTILAIHEDKNGVLWIGTYGGGLNKLIPPSDVKENLRNSLNQDQGEMNGIENKKVQFVHYTTKNGLSNNIICGILEDDYGNLWLSTNKGLSRFNPQTEEFKNYDINDGLQGNEFYVGSYLKSKNGELFFGGSNGFNNFYPKNIVNAHPPKINLTAFKKFGRKIEFEQPISDVKEIQLSYKDKFFTFEFVALHYKDPLKNQYAYMMAGFDEDWNYIGARREAIYTNLDPGDYTFRVKAANSDGVWNEEGMSIKISIAPPFWQTWWFYLLFSTGMVVSGYNFYRYKIKQIFKIERAKIGERERIQRKIAADFHDELGHRATKISLIAKLLKTQKYLSIQKISNDLDKIADNADCLYKEMKDFIWELDPGKDSIYDLVVQLKDFSDQLFDNTKIAFQLKDLSNELESILLSMSWRQNLLRIFKEGLHNVLKHASGCKNVILSVAIIDRNMELILSDDGQGFDQENCFLGNGIKNMHERANKINGELRISSQKEKGTKVHFVGELP